MPAYPTAPRPGGYAPASSPVNGLPAQDFQGLLERPTVSPFQDLIRQPRAPGPDANPFNDLLKQPRRIPKEPPLGFRPLPGPGRRIPGLIVPAAAAIPIIIWLLRKPGTPVKAPYGFEKRYGDYSYPDYDGDVGICQELWWPGPIADSATPGFTTSMPDLSFTSWFGVWQHNPEGRGAMVAAFVRVQQTPGHVQDPAPGTPLGASPTVEPIAGPNPDADPRPRPVPFPQLPYLPNSPIPSHGPERGNQPAPLTPPVTNPDAPGGWGEKDKTTITIGGTFPQDGPRPQDDPPSGGFTPREPPPRGTRERKVTIKSKFPTLLKLVGGLTESFDALNAIWEAIPEEKRPGMKWAPKKVWYDIYGNKHVGKWVRTWNPQPFEKIRYIWDHMEDVDWADAAKNHIENQIEDFAIGRTNQQLTKNLRRWYDLKGSPFGITTGPAL